MSCGILKSLKIDLRNKGISMVNIVSFCLSSLCPKTALFECFNFPLNYINNTLGCSDVLVLANNYIFTLKTRITVKYSFFFMYVAVRYSWTCFGPIQILQMSPASQDFFGLFLCKFGIVYSDGFELKTSFLYILVIETKYKIFLFLTTCKSHLYTCLKHIIHLFFLFYE